MHRASLAQSGRIEEARAFLAAARRSDHPPPTIPWVRDKVAFKTAELMGLYVDGPSRAGLDE